MKNKNEEKFFELEELEKINQKIIDISPGELSFMSSDSKIKDIINTQLQTYNDKYDKNITFDSMYDNLHAISQLSKLEKSELQAIFGDHIATSAFLIEYKAVITLIDYFDKFLNNVSNNEQITADEFSAGILKVILDFIPRISKLRDVYGVSNLDSIIRSKNNINKSENNKEFQELRNKLITT